MHLVTILNCASSRMQRDKYNTGISDSLLNAYNEIIIASHRSLALEKG
ncbi:MAG: hypothetical protein ABJH01_03750 [Algoriphagus sp.]